MINLELIVSRKVSVSSTGPLFSPLSVPSHLCLRSFPSIFLSLLFLSSLRQRIGASHVLQRAIGYQSLFGGTSASLPNFSNKKCIEKLLNKKILTSYQLLTINMYCKPTIIIIIATKHKERPFSYAGSRAGVYLCSLRHVRSLCPYSGVETVNRLKYLKHTVLVIRKHIYEAAYSFLSHNYSP